MDDKLIVFILDDYPTEKSNGCIFVKNIIDEIVNRNVKCVVVAPRILTIKRLLKKHCYHSLSQNNEGVFYDVYRPFYLHLSSKRFFMRFSMHNHYKAVYKVLKRNGISPDYVYGHFIYQNGITAARIGKLFGIPAYCAIGENCTRLQKGSQPYATGLSFCKWSQYLSMLTGVISVSQYNMKLAMESGFIHENTNFLIAPNGIDPKHFYKMDRETARRKLGIPNDLFVVAFTGAFSKRKGFYELCDALNMCDEVYSLFLGKGDNCPSCKNILFCNSVPNRELVYYLNAADIFVLPTKGEGCCNAIIEALACGLPVVSSNQPFNDGILDDNNSIRIDCNQPESIRDAILLLKNDLDLRNQLSIGAIKSIYGKDNKSRAERILQFMGLNN